jgi:phage baseplate assembly protein W
MAPRSQSKTAVEVGFPFKVNSYGRISDPDYELHVQQMIELVLFTAPGERVNRPEFGCGLLQVIYGPDTQNMASAVEYLVLTSLHRWMGDVITVRKVEVEPREDGELRVTLTYLLLRDRQLRVAAFEAPGAPWRR